MSALSMGDRPQCNDCHCCLAEGHSVQLPREFPDSETLLKNRSRPRSRAILKSQKENVAIMHVVLKLKPSFWGLLYVYENP